ncbi:MAG: NAD(P)-binding protein [Dehalococcoidia bacterium]|nr:NAD(P)-binding protein [Dehalococcoidia bacterium]
MWRFSVWGVAGLSAACELSKAGHRVALFEKKAYLGGQAGKFEVEEDCPERLYSQYFFSK